MVKIVGSSVSIEGSQIEPLMYLVIWYIAQKIFLSVNLSILNLSILYELKSYGWQSKTTDHPQKTKDYV